MQNSLRLARVTLGLTQAQLAVKAGVSIGIVNALEVGKRDDVKLSTMLRISNALDKPVTEVFSSFFEQKI